MEEVFKNYRLRLAGSFRLSSVVCGEARGGQQAPRPCNANLPAMITLLPKLRNHQGKRLQNVQIGYLDYIYQYGTCIP